MSANGFFFILSSLKDLVDLGEALDLVIESKPPVEDLSIETIEFYQNIERMRDDLIEVLRTHQEASENKS